MPAGNPGLAPPAGKRGRGGIGSRNPGDAGHGAVTLPGGCMNPRPVIPAKLVPMKAGSGNPETFMSEVDRAVASIESPIVPLIKPDASSEKVRHSRESGNPGTFVIEVDSRLRGNDGPKRPSARVACPHWQ